LEDIGETGVSTALSSVLLTVDEKMGLGFESGLNAPELNTDLASEMSIDEDKRFIAEEEHFISTVDDACFSEFLKFEIEIDEILQNQICQTAPVIESKTLAMLPGKRKREPKPVMRQVRRRRRQKLVEARGTEDTVEQVGTSNILATPEQAREASAPESNTCVEPEPREMAGECFR
jgi:hypothetical protein